MQHLSKIVAAISGAEHHPKPLPFFAFIPKGEAGLTKDSYALANQIRTVHEKRFVKIYSRVAKEVMKDIDKALRISLSL